MTIENKLTMIEIFIVQTNRTQEYRVIDDIYAEDSQSLRFKVPLWFAEVIWHSQERGLEDRALAEESLTFRNVNPTGRFASYLIK